MPLPRSLAEILGAHADALKHDIFKCVPATVTAVYPARQTVDVQIAVNNVVFDDLGNPLSEPAPGIADVPLGVMRGGGFFVWVPVQVNDSVLLVFSDLSTDVWRSGDGSPQDPGFCGKHTLDSPFAIPMVAPDAKFVNDPANDPNKLILGKDGSNAQIRLSATDIELGAPTTASVALNTLIDSFINTVLLASGGSDPGFTAFVSALQTWKMANGWGTTTTTVGSPLVKSG